MFLIILNSDFSSGIKNKWLRNESFLKIRQNLKITVNYIIKAKSKKTIKIKTSLFL